MAISDRKALAPESVEAWAQRLIHAGVPGLLLREKDLDDATLFALADRLRRLGNETSMMLSARFDLALAAGLDGVHLPANGLPTAEVVASAGACLRVGRSTHSVEEVRQAAAEGASYVLFGPIFATPSKAAFGPPLGLGALERAAALGLPVLALGGIDHARLPEVAAAGAWGAAGIRLFAAGEPCREVALTARELWGNLAEEP